MSEMRSLHSRSKSTLIHDLDWTAFVARHVRNLYARRDGAALGQAKMYERGFAVVAMADISGYSHLTSTLASRGDKGAEHLTILLNPYIQFMVDIVEKSGGDIVKFIGDAILIAWELKGSKEETVASACWGCMRLLERLGDHQAGIPGEDEKFPLSMHIGLAVGETFDIHVGTDQRMEYFLAGKAVKNAVFLVNVAQKKEMAVSGETFSILKKIEKEENITIEDEGRSGGIIVKKLEFPADLVSYNFSARTVPESPPSKKVYQKYINESCIHKITSLGSTEFEKMMLGNELRKVTVMFVKIEVQNVHTKESLSLLQSTIEVVQGVLTSFDGTLRQMVIDDKGASLLTVFGLPPLSHENNSIFGIRAALELRSLLRHLVSFSIGVTTGTVFTGIIGSRKRCDHTILGDAVNLAARMMCSPLAEKGILCDVATQKATKDETEFQKNEPQEFVKKAGPIDCFTVLGQKRDIPQEKLTSAPESEDFNLATSLIGRAQEMEIIQQTFKKFHDAYLDEKAIAKKFENVNKSRQRASGVDQINRSISFSGTILGSLKNTDLPRLIIEGEGGLGKSSLLVYTRDLGLQEGLQTCSVKADEVDKSTPYYVYRDILCDLFDLTIAYFEKHGLESLATEPEKIKENKEMRGRGNSSPNLMKGNEAFFAKRFIGSLGKSRSIHGAHAALAVGSLKNPGNVLAQLQDEATKTAFVEKTTFALNLLGLEPSSVNALSPIFPILVSGKSKSQEKKEMVGETVVKLLDRFTDAIAGLVLTIDDAHWMDALSYKLTWLIVRRCRGVFLALGSHAQHPSYGINREQQEIRDPIKSPSMQSLGSIEEESTQILLLGRSSHLFPAEQNATSFTLYTKIKTLPSTKLLELKGVSREDVEKIVALHCGFQVKAVHEKLLTEIVTKTGGNPLFVEKLALNMKGQKCFGVTPSMELILKGGQSMGSSPLDEFDWGNDPETAMLVQFDRLPSELQVILRIACVIGQSFQLDIVSEVAELKMTPKECFEMVTSYSESKGFIGWEDIEPNEKNSGYRLYFKSAVVQKCIYSAILSEQRQDLHYKIAVKYEQSLTPNNLEQLLPLIAFHYGNSRDLAKKIESLDRVSEHYVDAGSYSEAIASLTKLLQLVRDGEKKTDRNYIQKKSNQSRWHTLLGTAYVGRSEWSKGQRHLFEALEFLDFKYPNTPSKVRVELVKNRVEQANFWKKRHEVIPLITNPIEIESIKNIVFVLNSLYISFTFVGNAKSAELCLLLQLNFCESIGLEEAKQQKLHFGRHEANYAMLLWMKNKRSLALEYLSRARSLCEYSESSEDLQTYYNLRAVMHLSSGRIRESIECMDTIITLQPFHIVTIDKAAIALLDAQFAEHRNDAATIYEQAVDNSDDGSIAEAACFMIQSLLYGPPHFPEGITDVRQWISIIEEMNQTWEEVTKSSLHQLNISATLCLYYSYQKSPKARQAMKLFLSGLEVSAPRLSSPLGYVVSLSLFHFVIALHRLALDSPESKLKELIKALKQAEKALRVLKERWAFVIPIHSLAVGLKYWMKGSSKKALSTWRNALNKLDHISDNLKFVKAIIQVRIVRCAQGADALKMEAAEFLQRVGARTELAFLVGENFSPLPAIAEEEEEEVDVPGDE